MYRYICPNGGIVDEEEDCERLTPETDPEYTSTSNGVSISIDSIRYEEDDDQIRIREINYTIINNGKGAIRPKVGLKIYEKYTYEVKELGYLRNFELDDVLDVNEWVSRSEIVNIIIEKEEETFRLELLDVSPDPNEYVTAVWRKMDIS